MSNKLALKHSIIKDRVQIYKDFNDNLLSYIIKYYLGQETLSLEEDIKNYFMFCYNKVCDEFIKEEIDFSQNKELIDYYYTYYYHQFFKGTENKKQQYFIKFWNDIFNVDNPKNRNVLKVLVELYTIFDLSIGSKKNILELV